MSFLDYLSVTWPKALGFTITHIKLASISSTLAALVGIPLGVTMVRYRWLADTMLFIANIIVTIPSIALFGLMMSIFSRFGQGLGPVPATAAAFLYSLLPIVRNTHLALHNIEYGIKEAGIGSGMTFWQRLHLVDLPLSMPVIIGGIRTAIVMNIGVMTVASLVGVDSLGKLILEAINQGNMQKLMIGIVLISMLSVAADMLLQALQRLLTPRGIQK